MNILSALNNIHANREPKSQWARAVGIMKGMSEDEIAVCWLNFSSQIQCHDTANAIIAHSQYKLIFKGVVRDSRKQQFVMEESLSCPKSDNVERVLAEYSKLLEEHKLFILTCYGLNTNSKLIAKQSMSKQINNGGNVSTKDTVSEKEGSDGGVEIILNEIKELKILVNNEKVTRSTLDDTAIKILTENITKNQTEIMDVSHKGLVAILLETRQQDQAAMKELEQKLLRLRLNEINSAEANAEELSKKQTVFNAETKDAVDLMTAMVNAIPDTVGGILSAQIKTTEITALTRSTAHESKMLDVVEKIERVMNNILDLMGECKSTTLAEIDKIRVDLSIINEKINGTLRSESSEYDNLLDTIQETIAEQFIAINLDLKDGIEKSIQKVATGSNPTSEKYIAECQSTIADSLAIQSETLSSQIDTIDENRHSDTRSAISEKESSVIETPVSGLSDTSKVDGSKVSGDKRSAGTQESTRPLTPKPVVPGLRESPYAAKRTVRRTSRRTRNMTHEQLEAYNLKREKDFRPVVRNT
jgi:hypothetical protein